MKEYWLSQMAHTYAQSAAFFLLCMIGIIYFSIRHQIKKEQK